MCAVVPVAPRLMAMTAVAEEQGVQMAQLLGGAIDQGYQLPQGGGPTAALQQAGAVLRGGLTVRQPQVQLQLGRVPYCTSVWHWARPEPGRRSGQLKIP